MEIVLFILGGGFIVGGFFLLFEKPYYLVSLFIFFHFYNLNLELPGPLDLRGLVALLLTVRLIFLEKENLFMIQSYLLKKQVFWLLVLFSLLNIFVTYYYSETFLIKEFILNFITLILGFLALVNGNGIKVFFLGFALASILNFLDLAYSRFMLGELHVFRVFDVFFRGKRIKLNHNVAGAIASISFIFFFLRFIKNDHNKFQTVFVLLTAGLSIILSTSRGAIVSVFVLIPIILFYERKTLKILKKLTGFVVALLFGTAIAVGILFLFLPSININSSLIEKFNKRLIEDPLKSLNSNAKNYSRRGYVVKDNSEWRMMKYLHDIEKFSSYDLQSQFFGLGENGYENIGKINYIKGGFKQQYTAHNGFILMWIERGFIGLILYLLIVFSVIRIALFKHITILPSLSFILLFILFYAFSHNSELTNKFMFLLFGAIIGSFYLSDDYEDEDFDEESEEEYDNLDEEPQKMLGEL